MPTPNERAAVHWLRIYADLAMREPHHFIEIAELGVSPEVLAERARQMADQIEGGR